MAVTSADVGRPSMLLPCSGSGVAADAVPGSASIPCMLMRVSAQHSTAALSCLSRLVLAAGCNKTKTTKNLQQEISLKTSHSRVLHTPAEEACSTASEAAELARLMALPAMLLGRRRRLPAQQ